MGSRTIGALATRPTGNAQGNYYFFSLSSGRMVNRTYATGLPMPDDVIDRVHVLARRQRANPGIVFADRNRVLLIDEENVDDDDDDDDGSYNPDEHDDEYEHHEDDEEEDNDHDEDDESDHSSEGEDDDDDNHPDDNAEDSGDNDAGSMVDNEHDDNSDSDDDNSINDQDDRDEDAHDNDDNDPSGEDSNNNVTDGTAGVRTTNDDDAQTAGVRTEQDTVSDVMDAKYGVRTSHHNLRRRRTSDHVPSANYHDKSAQVHVQQESCEQQRADGHMHTLQHSEPPMTERIVGTSQMSMKAGIKMFGERGVKAVRSELQQLHDANALKPVDLTYEQRREALAYLMFLKEKRCGKMKGRGCADGRPQRRYTAKEDAASPTVSTESVFLTIVIDALEGRDVAVVDIPGAFLQVDMDEEVHMRIVGKMADLLIEIDPEMYLPHATKEKGQTVLYVELLKALYGTMRAARLFWEKLSNKLIEWGYTINPYDPCVANKVINGKQCTVIWHVNDLKISHVETEVVDDFIAHLDAEFGKDTPLSKSRGKVHDYLGMIIDFSKPGEVAVDMMAYVKMVLSDIPDDMVGRAVTPAANHLFNINSQPTFINEKQADMFHHITMQLMYLSQRGRPDIRPAILFLSGRVTKPDVDDYRKLSRVIKYLQATSDLVLSLSSDGSGTMEWWVDASYALHPDMKGHTGGTMSMGKGSIYSTSTKQKLVARSSTESELIGAYDVLPQILWTQNFMEAQGHEIRDTVLYQDNMSAILLEKNGKMSSGRRTRHINIRYFYIKDHIKSGSFCILHCPTARMIGDYFTKPLQGRLFRLLRDLIMGIDPSSVYHSDHRSVLMKDEEHGPRQDDKEAVKHESKPAREVTFAEVTHDAQTVKHAQPQKTYLHALTNNNARHTGQR